MTGINNVQHNDTFAFIFDMDGVLVDNMHMHARSWVELFQDYGLEGLDPDRYLRETAGMKGLDVLRHFLDKDITPEKAEQLTELKDFLYRFMYRDEIRPIEGLEAFLDRAESMKIKLGVGTGAGARNIEYTLGIPGLKNRFNAVVGSHQVRYGKPHPDIFLRVAELLETEPSRCIVFEDALPGLEAAYAAGMKSIALATTNPAEIMRDRPGVMAVIDDFTAISPEKILEKSCIAQPSAS
ncbi:beta-phosphoglucomutase family hydrolase [Prosthecochloris sp. SCSIO W1101]|uniref:HAD family hydrolase n=1 Tax=Prosthecochloris sp. SCSIO W1101 TaxID=2992242 RepID=UPI00223D72AE|nr:beta-phosphoglucomutase family hydrolase [Prosthecochloris sp. SCSIO W1101]UZJ41383.1 beta-phosphoglucomutase family hydrolase [Prosthecochloris sp. SCSIO W1101]